MFIESKIQRDGGTEIELGDQKYHFTPNEYGDHVALVENEAHQSRLLSITEGYRFYSMDGKRPQRAAQADEPQCEGDDSPAELRKKLAAEYRSVFDKAPARTMTVDDIRAALAAAQADEA